MNWNIAGNFIVAAFGRGAVLRVSQSSKDHFMWSLIDNEAIEITFGSAPMLVTAMADAEKAAQNYLRFQTEAQS